MTARIALGVLLSGFFLSLVVGPAKAQDPAKQLDQLTAAVNRLSAQVVTRTDLENAVKDLVTQRDLTAVKADVAAMNRVLAEQDAEIRKLKLDFNRVTDSLHKQIGDQEAILRAISRQDSQGRYVPNMSANMDKSPELRQEMSDVVQRSLLHEGTLRVQNNTSTDQYLRVNSVDWRIPAFSVINIAVPVGTVTTELVGYESPKNWTVAAPSYLQVVDIIPTRPVWHSTGSSVIVGPPMIVRPSRMIEAPIIFE